MISALFPGWRSSGSCYCPSCRTIPERELIENHIFLVVQDRPLDKCTLNAVDQWQKNNSSLIKDTITDRDVDIYHGSDEPGDAYEFFIKDDHYIFDQVSDLPKEWYVNKLMVHPNVIFLNEHGNRITQPSLLL